MLHHQHTKVTVTEPLEMSRTAPQVQLLKLHAVFEQEHHGVQQLTLETARQEPGTKQGGRRHQVKTRRKDYVQPLPESNIPEIMKSEREKQDPLILHRAKELEI